MSVAWNELFGESVGDGSFQQYKENENVTALLV